MFKTTTFATERLLLRPLAPPDAADLFAVFSDPEVMRYWSSAPWEDIGQAERYIASAAQDLASGAMLRVGIVVAATGQLIGQLALHHFDVQNRRCEIGYALGRAHWGKGYMAEAMRALLGHAFAELALNRIEADVDPRNPASMRALERLGFVHEGLLRERWIVAGEICDTAFYGLLKSDWDSR
jgi:ribosomal-protein-alanine N-acetyltransferase